MKFRDRLLAVSTDVAKQISPSPPAARTPPLGRRRKSMRRNRSCSLNFSSFMAITGLGRVRGARFQLLTIAMRIAFTAHTSAESFSPLGPLGTRIFFQQSVKLPNPCLNSDDRLFRRGIGEGCSQMHLPRLKHLKLPVERRSYRYPILDQIFDCRHSIYPLALQQP
jgi:hypothetical protein